MQNKNLDMIFPEMNPDELGVVEENLDRYLELAWEIWQEVHEKKSPG